LALIMVVGSWAHRVLTSERVIRDPVLCPHAMVGVGQRTSTAIGKTWLIM